MRKLKYLARASTALSFLLALPVAPAVAQELNWKQFQGQAINVLSSNHPWANAVLANRAEFKTLTGIDVRVDTFQEAQMRQRLVTVFQSRSSDVDLFMSLKSREGQQFANAGQVCLAGTRLTGAAAATIFVACEV